jgi:hypothetical protein
MRHQDDHPGQDRHHDGRPEPQEDAHASSVGVGAVRLSARTDPFGRPVDEVLELPHGELVLDRIDQSPALVEGCRAVCRRDGGDDGEITHLQLPHSMDDRDAQHVRLFGDERCRGEDHVICRRMGRIVERLDSAICVVIAHRAHEYRLTTCRRMRYGRQDLVNRERLVTHLSEDRSH